MADKIMECVNGTVYQIIHIPRPYYRVHVTNGDGSKTIEEYGKPPTKACDND